MMLPSALSRTHAQSQFDQTVTEASMSQALEDLFLAVKVKMLLLGFI